MEVDPVRECIAFLDSIGYTGGRGAAQGALAAHKRNWPRNVLEQALRQRKAALNGTARNAA
jgi:hypothetical protein